MAGPAHAKAPSTMGEKVGFQLVEDAYFRYADVVFTWAKYLEPNHGSALAVKPLISARSITSPEHPLYDPEEGGLKLYIGYDSMGAPRLLFHLKQLEYLQYYIHELHLTSPAWVEYNNKRGELLDNGKEEEAERSQPPTVSEEDRDDDWVPLPDSIIQADYFQSIEPITLHSSFFLNKVSKQIQKESKKAESNKRLGYPPPKFSSNRFDALKDNMTPGPGLRKGPERQGKPGRGGNQHEADDGTGWGGFPLAKPESKSESEEKEAAKIPESADINDKLGETAQGSDQGEQPTLNEPTTSSPSLPPTPLPSELAGDYGMRYHFHCQQAFLLAVSGGLAETFPSVAKSSDTDEADEGENEVVMPEIGRSLFISLCVTRWEKDPKVILEVGWSAIWWQKKLEDEMVEGEPPFEEMRDFGHLIISDHLVSKRNGEIKPDYRDDYLFGDSLPLEQDKLRAGIQRKIKDLAKKSGEGPIYVVTHTPAGQEIVLNDIGLSVSSWHVDLQPDGWDVPPYMSAAGCGSVFVINTACLFGSIEQVPPDPASSTGNFQAVGRTKKSLQHTALLMFSKDSGRKPEKCGNAGNDAFYTLEIFLAIMVGPPLPELRAEFEHSQTARTHLSKDTTPPETDLAEKPDLTESSASPTEGEEVLQSLAAADSIPSGLQDTNAPALSSGDGASGLVIEGESETDEADDGFPTLHDIKEKLVYDQSATGDGTEREENETETESDDDPMDDDIQGVYYEDDDGNLVELSD
ncbi:hypothetical protein IAU59_004858 [Kwoniella sp. CBS 9459]